MQVGRLPRKQHSHGPPARLRRMGSCPGRRCSTRLARYPVLSKDIERIKEISRERLSSVAEVADSTAVAKLLNGPLNDPVPGGDAV